MPFTHKVVDNVRGLFSTTTEFADGVHAGTPAVAGITEIDSSGRPFLGSAPMRILNVVPGNERFQVVGDISWDHPLRVRVTVIYL